MNNYQPENLLLRAAAFWLGSNSAVIAQDLAGLNNSKTVEFTLRLPAIIMTIAGAIALFLVILMWIERKLKSFETSRNLWVNRFFAAVIIGLCIGAPILSHLSFAGNYSIAK